MEYYQGKFKPRNPQKYLGNVDNIVFRSSWEFAFMKYLDTNQSVIQWASEEIAIPYVSPVDNRVHRYFVDFWIKKKSTNGKTECLLIEIKPKVQMSPPKQPKRRTPKYINEMTTYAVNQSKFTAAKKFAEERNWKFVVLTEQELFNQKSKA